MLRRNFLSTTSTITRVKSSSPSIIFSIHNNNNSLRFFSLPGQKPQPTSVKNFSAEERRQQMERATEERERQIKEKVDAYKKKYHLNAREMFFGLILVSLAFIGLFIGGGSMLPRTGGLFEDPDRGGKGID